MSGVILIDGNAVGHAANRATVLSVPGSNGKPFETQAVFGFIKGLRDLRVSYPDRSIVVLWDGKATWRFDIDPDYKGNRAAKTEKEQAKKDAYELQKPLIQAAVSRLGIRQLLNRDMEADDLAGWIATKSRVPTLLVTGDRDWLQLVNEWVSWYDPRNGGREVKHADFFAATGYKTPRAFLQGKALMGDNSDNIKGVGGIGEQGAPEFLALHGDVYEFRKRYDAGAYAGQKLRTAATKLATVNWSRFERNVRLMDLMNVPTPCTDAYVPFDNTLNIAGFRAICERLSFISVLRKFDEFVQPFKETP